MMTLPNWLTIARIAAAPALVLAFLCLDRAVAGPLAVALFALAAATDFFDGWLARRLGQETALGRMLDPIADKVMVIVGLMLVVALEAGEGLPWAITLPATVIMMREVLVSGLREFLGDVKLPVTALAKFKTTAQLLAIGLFLLDIALGAGAGEDAGGGADGTVAIIALVMLWIAGVLTAVTGWDYFAKGIAHIAGQDAPAGNPKSRAQSPEPEDVSPKT